MQWHFTKPESQTKVKLLGPLFSNDDFGNTIFANNPRTAKSYNDIALILLILFVPWDCLHSLFMDISTINNNYLSFY